jgi:hypothetical protein
MVSPQDLDKGRAYFQVTYEDREFTIPVVDTMIYIGADILEPDPLSEQYDGPRFAFQDTVSFSRFGSAIEYQGAENLADEGACVYSFTLADLESIFDLSGVVGELTQALERVHQLEK